MADKYPLIRIPTQPARLTLFGVFVTCGLFLGIFLGFIIGHRFFGVAGAIIGTIVGGLTGRVIGVLPGHFAREQMFREMQRSSNEELKAKLEQPLWSFYQTLALLNLHLRGEDVQSYLPRVLTLLESNDYVTRLFGRDALALVFTPLAKEMHDFGYSPSASVEDCRSKVAKLREKIN